MKSVIPLLMILASGITTASQTVTVTGIGENITEARNDALQKAVMNHCKSAVVSDKIFRNREKVRDKVVIYNGCLVKNYTVDDENTTLGKSSITITAEVVQNHLPDRIINKPSDWFFYDMSKSNNDKRQISARIKNAKELINEIFIDYPSSAFVLERSDYVIDYAEDKSYLTTSFTMTWNKNFILALEDTADILKEKKGQWAGTTGIIQVKRRYLFTNMSIPNHVREIVFTNRPAVRLRILDSSEHEYINNCYQLREPYLLYDAFTFDSIKFNVNGSITGSIDLRLPDNLPDDIEIIMDVVPVSFCKVFLFAK